jgi:acetyl-CoA acyltransferase
MKNVVIAGYKRSPFHFAYKGALAKLRADDIAAEVVKALVAQSGVNMDDIEDLICGCSFPEAEQGFNVARLISFIAGLPLSVGAVTVNRFCGSSMQSIHQAAGAIQMGAGEVFICCGVESMSRVPMVGFNPMPNPALYSEMPAAYMGMGETAENVAKQYNLSREEQDAFAVLSHQKAAKAQAEGRFVDEIVPINGIAQDGCIRSGVTIEDLAGLKLAFDQNGTVTAGTSSPLTDGASAVLVCSEKYADAHGLEKLARIKSIAVSGCGPDVMGLGPIKSSQKALARAGLSINDIDIIEINEAFASQSIASLNDLGIDRAKVNLDGGAIALGHPLGATGARIVGKAASLLKREGGKYSLSTQCIGGGQGIATILEAI